jgi:peptidoglycan/LPS O-acetylase OafA/YrhL
MLVFAASPLFVWQLNWSTKTQVLVCAALLLLSTVVQRPIMNTNPLHSLLYFLPIYMIGILCSVHRVWLVERLQRRKTLLILGIAAVTSLQIWIHGGHHNNFKESFLEFAGFDLIPLQKLMMCLLVLSYLPELEKTDFARLKALAMVSFAIYFLHTWVIGYVWKPLIKNLYPADGPSALPFVLSLPLIAFACVLIAKTIGRVLGDRSRYVIGWSPVAQQARPSPSATDEGETAVAENRRGRVAGAWH